LIRYRKRRAPIAKKMNSALQQG